MTDQVLLETWVLEVPWRNWFKASRTRVFRPPFIMSGLIILFEIIFFLFKFFGIFDDFSKWSKLKAMGNLEKSSNMSTVEIGIYHQ